MNDQMINLPNGINGVIISSSITSIKMIEILEKIGKELIKVSIIIIIII